ncbi:MAG: hypothetical protein CM1200mP24_06090 [Gammaproteobacteria bacterium]|nr:MAG: hypothetical protein CM1200mP24_06090 [Gammaproteobacteria bacterium]
MRRLRLFELTREAKEVGADAALLVTPYYNKPTQEGLYRHYSLIAESVDIPMVLYNVPPRTACDMQAETVARLAPIDNIVGIKEACGDAERVGEIKKLVSDDSFIVLSGEDAQTFRMMELGAVGTISVTANVLPRQMAEFCENFYQTTRMVPPHGTRNYSLSTTFFFVRPVRFPPSGR